MFGHALAHWREDCDHIQIYWRAQIKKQTMAKYWSLSWRCDCNNGVNNWSCCVVIHVLYFVLLFSSSFNLNYLSVAESTVAVPKMCTLLCVVLLMTSCPINNILSYQQHSSFWLYFLTVCVLFLLTVCLFWSLKRKVCEVCVCVCTSACPCVCVCVRAHPRVP